MFGSRFLRILCLAALGLALFDNFADVAGCDDSKTAATACHVCACASHVAPQRVSEIVLVPPAPIPHSSYQPAVYAFLPSDSTFRPPCLAA